MSNTLKQTITPPIPIPHLNLEPNAGTPLYRQLYEGLRRAILVGELSPGVRLPSTRALAADLSIGRNTVLNAYEQLLAEGYLEGRTGSGTYVAAELPDHLLRVRSDDNRSANSRRAGRELSSRGHLLTGATGREPHDFAIPRAFRPGLPALDIFPFKTWSRLWNKRWRSPSLDLLGYGDPAGYRPLREIIASYLGAVRGVRCEADQVIMIAGSQQALYIVTRVLLNEGDVVWVEDPGYPGARGAFQGAEDFGEAVLTAVNLGDDADTTGAVCGQLAGACWGESGIPAAWRDGLARKDIIEPILAKLLDESE